MRLFFLLLFFLTLISCSPSRRHVHKDASFQTLSGTLTIATENFLQPSLPIITTLSTDSVICRIFTPFGASLLSMYCGKDSLLLVWDDHDFLVSRDAKIQEIVSSVVEPFSWDDISYLVSGELPDSLSRIIDQNMCDTVSLDKNQEIVIERSSRGRVRRVFLRGYLNIEWRRFSRGRFRDIRVLQNNRKIIHIQYE